jgi:hypothetical protein
MGEARRRKAGNERISWCRTCTLCCTLPDILALDKPMYRPCRHIRDQGCGLFGQPERPRTCEAYMCAYLSARLSDAPDRNRIPHPLEAGAYFHRDPIEKAVVLFVDPARPELWKRSGLVACLRPWIERGHVLLVIDRGRRMTIGSVALFDEVLKRDYVRFAEAEGRPLDIPEFAVAQAPAP